MDNGSYQAGYNAATGEIDSLLGRDSEGLYLYEVSGFAFEIPSSMTGSNRQEYIDGFEGHVHQSLRDYPGMRTWFFPGIYSVKGDRDW